MEELRLKQVKPLVFDVDGKLQSRAKGDTWGAYVVHENASSSVAVLQWILVKDNLEEFVNTYSKITLNLTASVSGWIEKKYESATFELNSKDVMLKDKLTEVNIINVYRREFITGGVQAFVKVGVCVDSQFIFFQVHTAAGGGGNSIWHKYQYADINITSITFSS